MTKKHSQRQPQPPQRKSKRTRIALVGVVILILALVAVLTFQPGNNRVTTTIPMPDASGPTYIFKKQGELRILDPAQNHRVSIDIELAQDESQRQLGLMYREKMAEHQGMLFLFDDEDVRAFWMKNTILSLDILFINSQNEIVTIHKYTTPYSEDTYMSTKRARYVLEVNGGFTEKYHVRVGDKISWNRM